MTEGNIKIKTFRLQIASSGQQVSLDSETDILYNKITGIKANVSKSDAEIGSTLMLGINEQEIFPDNFDLINITSSQDCPVDDRFYTENGKLEIPARGSSVKIRYTDGGNSKEYPYVLSIVLIEKK